MEPVAAISFASTGGSRAAGWQQQVRVDYVVNKVMQTHRGRSAEQVAQAIRDQLRAVGVVPNKRQIAQYASAISALPEFPPTRN
jgi:ABC-type glutathione transport system ATPase component